MRQCLTFSAAAFAFAASFRFLFLRADFDTSEASLAPPAPGGGAFGATPTGVRVALYTPLLPTPPAGASAGRLRAPGGL